MSQLTRIYSYNTNTERTISLDPTRSLTLVLIDLEATGYNTQYHYLQWIIYHTNNTSH